MGQHLKGDAWDMQLFAGEEPQQVENEPDALPGEQQESAPAAGEPAEEFETLIRGKYKKAFDERVQKILDGRLRKARGEQEKLRRQRTLRESSAREALERLENDAPAIQACYPEFDWKEELKDPRFGRMIAAGCAAMDAYEVLHREEVLRRAMAYSAKETREKIARSLASGRRIAENGSMAHSAAVVRTDPGKLTSQELGEIRKRVLSGEKIKF